MKAVVVLGCLVLVTGTWCRAVSDEESVVSIYTTLSPAVETSKPLDVYHQIANNIAERITSPIFKFLGIKNNKTNDQHPKKADTKIKGNMQDYQPVTQDNNDINETPKLRDVEELSEEALKKIDKKPEKITLFSNYIEANETSTINPDDISDDFDDDFFEDDDNSKDAKEGGLVYYIELIAGYLQLVWGALAAIFKPSS